MGSVFLVAHLFSLSSPRKACITRRLRVGQVPRVCSLLSMSVSLSLSRALRVGELCEGQKKKSSTVGGYFFFLQCGWVPSNKNTVTKSPFFFAAIFCPGVSLISCPGVPTTPAASELGPCARKSLSDTADSRNRCLPRVVSTLQTPGADLHRWIHGERTDIQGVLLSFCLVFATTQRSMLKCTTT